jgi:hypothetical protein
VAGVDRIRYARNGEVAIAYAIVGKGPQDLLFAHSFAGIVEIEFETPFMRPSWRESRSSPG